MYVKDINVLLSQVGSQMKVRMSTPDQLIYKQVWSLGLQQEFEMPLLHTFIITDQHHSNLDIVYKLQSCHHGEATNSTLIIVHMLVTTSN